MESISNLLNRIDLKDEDMFEFYEDCYFEVRYIKDGTLKILKLIF